MLNKKIYYAENTIYEVIQVACEWGLQDSAFVYNAFTYLSRIGKKTTGHKNILLDLKKAKFYIEKEKELLEIKKNNHIVFFKEKKIKSMLNDKDKKRQNVKMIMAFWGYGEWFDYCSSDNKKFYLVHKEIINIFKNFNNSAYGYGSIFKNYEEIYITKLQKILNRLEVLIWLMKVTKKKK